jgi:hypothetical protein
MAKLIPGFEAIAKKINSNTLTDDDIMQLTSNPFEQEEIKGSTRRRTKKTYTMSDMINDLESDDRQAELEKD